MSALPPAHPAGLSRWLRPLVLGLSLLALVAALGAEELDELRERAQRGESVAQRDYGLRMIRMQHDPAAQTEGIRWLKLAGEKGDVTANFYLGLCHAIGRGTAKNLAEAFRWYQRAADGGLDIGQFNVGLYLLEGRGTQANPSEAVRYFRLAAAQNLDSAQLFLAMCYRKGEGVATDAKTAYEWFLKAAAQNNSDAQYYAGLACANGEGVARNIPEALKWFRAAADQGDAQAQRNLGLLYSMGDGLPRDNVEALAWLILAVDNGEDAAYRDKLAGESKPAEVAAAQARAKQLGTEIDRRRRALIASSAVARDDRLSFENALRDVNSTGSGFFIGDGSFFVTNHHVIADAFLIRVRTRWHTVTATVVHDDPQNDLAILKLPRRFPTLPIGPSRGVRLGDRVFTLGFPNPEVQGLSPKLTRGETSSLTGLRDDPRYFQVSVPIQPGNSGGPLIDEKGRVVGVITSTLNAERMLAMTGNIPQNVNYALKSAYLLSLLERLQVPPESYAPVNLASSFEEAARQAEDAAGTVLVY
ncbi:MAG TPA: tetratricopeptide repeat-containing serine protease family protein [Opitutaceae bacterium]|nr:tetratricopeptide repeat-containing serine protease family protein [Opitutaceae bacterium]